MQDRRKISRPRTFFGGTIAFNKRCSTISCTVRNMTDAGAKLAFANTGTVPNHFDLIIRARDTDIPARVIWRNDNEAGVTFNS